MSNFLFDESSDDKRLIADCNTQGMCEAKRYPAELRGKKDYEILPIVMAGEDCFVTFDGRIIDQHSEFVPHDNPGIVIIRLRRPSRTMTSKIARSLLSEFKRRYAQWATETWFGIRLEITETGVFVSNGCPRLRSDPVEISYQSSTFEKDMKRVLAMLSGQRAGAPG